MNGNARRGALRRATMRLSVLAAAGALLAHAPVQGAPRNVEDAAATVVYTLQPGDNPWTVSERFLADMRDWSRVVQFNRIRDDRRLQPNQALRIPAAWLRTTPSQAQVLYHRGEVAVRTPQGQALPVAVGLALDEGSVLSTGAQGSLTLKLEDGSVFLVRPDTEAVIERLVRTPLGPEGAAGPMVQFALALKRGAVDNLVRRQPAAGRYEVRTPSAVAAVRGTEFRIAADADAGVARTEVLDGSVAVGNDQGRALLPRHTGNVARSGAAPEPPRALLAAPQRPELPPVLERLPIDLPLPPVPGAARYRSQLLTPGDTPALVADGLAEAPRVRLTDAPNGEYVLQLRALDADGVEGLGGRWPVRVHARPFAPILMAPAPNAVVTQARPQLQWARAEGRQVRLQLSRDPAFATGVIAIDGNDAQGTDAGTAVVPQDLAPGLWHWRAAAVTAAEGAGPWSDAQALRRVIPGPGVEAPQAQDGAVVLRWPAAPGAQRYRVQVTPGAAGAAPVLDAQPQAPQVTLSDLPPGTYAVRVQAIDADDQVGPWGPPQQFTVPPPRRSWDALWLLVPLLLPLL